MKSPGNVLTSELLSLLGSPFAKNREHREVHDPLHLCDFATRNRIQLLCIDSLLEYGENKFLSQRHSELLGRFKRTLGAFANASRLLAAAEIEHAFFKSLRPYKEVTVDLDILIFGDGHRNAANLLRDRGYRLLEEGPMSTTFHDRSVPLNLDLYKEIAVSRFIYLDKDKLRRHTTAQRLENGTTVRSLDDKSDLLALIAHSVIKEHMYVLSEYFTTLGSLSRMSAAELEAFVHLARECNVEYAVSTHLNITALLHQYAYGFAPSKLKSVIGGLRPSLGENARLAGKNPDMPHRYRTATLLNALMEKVEEPKARRSMISQLRGLSSPYFGATFLKAVIQHKLRESY